MSDRAELLSADSVAAAVAPIIDRLRIAIARRVPAAAEEMAGRYGLTPPVGQVFSMLRNTMPDRAVAMDDVREVFLYADRQQTGKSLHALMAGELLEHTGEKHVRLTDRGRSAIAELHAITTGIVEEMWAGHEQTVDGLRDITAKAAAAVGTTGGPACRVVAPAYEPPDARASMIVAERLTPLRFHRYDAHAAAWRAAGLTVEQVIQLGSGALRDKIEAETNRRAAAPYEVLDVNERLALVTGLGALPN